MKQSILYVALAGAAALLITFLGFLGLNLFYKPQLPDAASLKTIEFQIPLKVYSRDGKLITEYGEKLRAPVDFEDLPQDFINALTSVEDRYFFEHSGVEPKALLRAFIELLMYREIRSGGSTLTMQAARNFFLDRDKTFVRKYKEILLAIEMEKQLTKEEIFELYANKVFLGNRAYGFQSAAQIYYGKTLDQLTIAQLAMLAGIPKAPSDINPVRNPAAATERRNFVLYRMNQLGHIDQATYEEQISQPVTAQIFKTPTEINAAHVGEMVRQFIVSQFGDEVAQSAGLQVYTTLLSQHQFAAEKAVVTQLENYDERHGYRGAADNISATLESLALPKNLTASSELSAISMEHHTTLGTELRRFRPVQNLMSALVLKVNKESALLYTYNKTLESLHFEEAKWARKYLSADGMGPKPEALNEIIKTGDIIYIKPVQKEKATVFALSQVPSVESGFVSLDANDGAVLALVGSFDFNRNSFNNVVQAKRQMGSTIKPLLYSAALANGFNAASIFMDAPLPYSGNDAWRPANSNQQFGGPTRLREALYRSKNLVSIRLMQQLQFEFLFPYFERFGLDTKGFPKDLSVALGSVSASPMTVAKSYAHFANGGYTVEPYFIHHVIDKDGNILFKSSPKAICPQCSQKPIIKDEPTLQYSQAPLSLDPANMYIMDSILKDVIKRGTATSARSIGRGDIGGKTGTTNDQFDAWFSGYIPKTLAATAWVGFSNPATLGKREYGGRAALPIWKDYITAISDQYPEQYLAEPSNIVTLPIDAKTGKITHLDNEDKRFELFIEGFFPEAAADPEESSENYDDLSQELF